MVANEFVYRLSLSRGSGFAGTDRPYGFISDNCAFERRRALGFQNGVDLTGAHFFRFARFVFRFGFTDAQNRDQTLLFQYREFPGDKLVGLFVVGTALGVADDDVFSADVFQHFGRGFAGERAGQVQVNVLRAQVNVAARSGLFRQVDVHLRRSNGNCTAGYASQFGTQVRDQFVYHVAAAVQFPVTHH